MQVLKPKDLIALALILGGILLEVSGHDGPLAPLIAMVVGYYFGERQVGTHNGVSSDGPGALSQNIGEAE